MLYKTKGLVLNTIHYNEKYHLTHIITEQFGLVTYMIPKSSGRKSKFSQSFFFPLNIICIEAEHLPKRDIQRIKEISIGGSQHHINFALDKSSMAFFLSEFLFRVLRDTPDNRFIFSFLENSVEILTITDKSIANFHLVFMIKLSRILGFYPNFESYSPNSMFDMINGVFSEKQPLHNHYINTNESAIMVRLSRLTYENMHKFRFKRDERALILKRILEYYRLHLYEFPELKSMAVLHELF